MSAKILLTVLTGSFLLATACIKKGMEIATRGDDWRACGPDHRKFCADVKVGEGRVIKCLSEHLDRLSPACLETHKKNTRKG